jgi:hypothetical protein
VDRVGFEPTMFLMWRIYSPLPSTNSAHLSKNFITLPLCCQPLCRRRWRVCSKAYWARRSVCRQYRAYLQYALLLLNFLFYKKNSILRSARLEHVLSALRDLVSHSHFITEYYRSVCHTGLAFMASLIALALSNLS